MKDRLQSRTCFYERYLWHIKSMRNAFSVMPASGIASALKRRLSNVMVSSALIRINALVVEPVMP